MEADKGEPNTVGVVLERQMEGRLNNQATNVVSLQAMAKGTLARKRFACSIRYCILLLIFNKLLLCNVIINHPICGIAIIVRHH